VAPQQANQEQMAALQKQMDALQQQTTPAPQPPPGNPPNATLPTNQSG
jgi:hypothetical protein